MKKERTIKLTLTDDECMDLTEKAHSVGLSVSELLENFISDLVGNGNGSDERQKANDWFNRCWFGMFPQKSFVPFLIEDWRMDDFLIDLKWMREYESEIQSCKEELTDTSYQWFNIYTCVCVNGVRISKRCYQSRNDFENEINNQIAALTEDLNSMMGSMREAYRAYVAWAKNDIKLTFDEAIAEVEKYQAELDRFMIGDEEYARKRI